MKISTLLCLFALALSISCGKKADSSAPTPRRIVPVDPKQIEIVMRRQVMDCDAVDGGKCPDGVARLLIIDPTGVRKAIVCSGFMVSKTKLVTNHHCVPDEAACKDTNVAVYHDGGYHRTKCKKLIKAKEDHENPKDLKRKVDFAVFEIAKEFEGTTFKLSKSRATPEDEVTAWVIDHTGLDAEIVNNSRSRVTEFKCEVQKQNESHSLMLLNCPIINGNSGSPALNSSGEVIGVIWGGTNPTLSTQTPLKERRASSGKGAVTEMIHFEEFI